MNFKKFGINNVKEYVIKNPPILVGLLLIFLGIVFFALGSQITASSPKDFLSSITIFVFVLVILFSALVTHIEYKKNKRPYDSAFIPLFFSVFFMCMTLILILFFEMFKQTYIDFIERELNHIAFPLAIFALGITLYYFFAAQFSTDRKLDSILNLNREKNNFSENEPEVLDSLKDGINKDYKDISEEDKLIFEHLFQRHNNLLLFIDALDTKFSQIIALNGLILSFILIKSTEVKNIYIYVFGLSLIIVTIIIGVYGYKTRECLTGAHEKFFSAYDNFQPGEGIKKLKDRLILDIEANTETQNQKADIFNKMLIVNVIALIIVIFGYYV